MFMRHPKSGPITETTEEAFTTVWEPRGWEQVTDEEGRQAAAAAALADLSVIPGQPSELLTASAAGPQAYDEGGQLPPAYPTSTGSVSSEPTAADVAAFDPITADVDEVSKPLLVAAAKAKGLSSTGSKADILARLQHRDDVAPPPEDTRTVVSDPSVADGS